MRKKAILHISLFFLLTGVITKLNAQNSIYEHMVLIPGGSYVTEKIFNKDSLSHIAVEIQIDSFYIDKYEVTNAEYYKFCKETGHRLPFYWDKEGFNCGVKYPNHPVIGVSFNDAKKYAELYGKRLPTEAEWEYAAHGGSNNIFPWGDEIDSTLSNYGKHYKELLPVGTFKPNNFGLYDLSGNVWEWTSERSVLYLENNFDQKEYQFLVSSRFRIIKGGSWYSGAMCTSVNSKKALPFSWIDFAVGFRCAADIHPEEKDE